MKRLLFLFTFMVAFVGSHPVQAAAPYGYVGGDLGIGIPIGLPGGDPRFTFGFDGGAFITDEFSLGGYFITSSQSVSIVSISFTYIGIDARYHNSGFNVGGRIGLGIEKAGSLSDTEFAPGFVAGYDFEIAPGWAIGPEINWMMIFGSDTDEGYSMFNILAAVQYRFGSDESEAYER